MKNLFKKILAVGLAATMTLGMAVTSFAEEEPVGGEESPVAAAAEVWVNGKDVKANADKGIEADLNKTYIKELADLVAEDTGVTVAEGEEATEGEEAKTEPQVGLNAELGEGNKYVVAVSDKDDEEITTIDKAIVNGKAVKSDLAKASYKKANDKKKTTANITVTAGKKAGTAVIWVAEINKAKEIVAYASFEVDVKVAPKKFTLVSGEVEKKKTVNVTEEVALAVNNGEEVVSEDATYTWTIKAPKGIPADTTEVYFTLAADGKNATFTASAMTTTAKADKYTITCVNDQSQKKATFTVTVVNDLTSVTLGDIELETATEDKVVKELVCNSDYTVEAAYAPAAVDGVVPFATTDKVKLYVAEVPKEGNAYEIDETGKAPKFKFTGTKATALTAKVAKDGKITLTAKKGTEAGTQVQLIWVSTHADKTIDVFTTIVTIGEAKAEEPETPACTCEPVEGVHQEGCPLYVAPEAGE